MISAFLSVLLAATIGASVSVELNSHSFSQGETVRIEAEGVAGSCTLLLDGEDYPFYEINGSIVALVGIPADFRTGLHQLQLTDSLTDWKISLDVRPTVYSREQITFPADKKDLLDVDISHEREVIREALCREGDDRFWRASFSIPVQGRISSPYGTRRNGGYHRGVDISAAIGTMVAAPARGVVTVADHFPIHGKTVVLDHGQGISTVYCHLDTILVAQGDTLEKTSGMARVGNTGLGTAPHLHWGLYVHGVPVNPMRWLTEDY